MRERTEFGARGQDDRHPRPEHDPRRVRLGEEGEVLGQHVAGFEIRHDEDLGAPRDRGLDALDLRRLGIDGVVEGERAVEDAAGDLAALGHLAERGRVDRRGDFRGHRLDGREDRNPRRAEADLREQIDGVLHDVALGIEIGKDVDGRIGDEQRLGIGRHIHDEDVADPARGAQAGLAGRHLAHEFVGVQAALHQELALGLVDELDRLCRCGVAVRRVDNLKTLDIEPWCCATAAIFAAGPTRIGTMMPACAASTAPRSEVSSQGCTTTVVAGGTCFARAISRSYLRMRRTGERSDGGELSYVAVA